MGAATALAELLEGAVISPSTEMGAFEALWANGASSFKQLRKKLVSSRQDLLSALVDKSVATQCFQEALRRLHAAGINDFNVKMRVRLITLRGCMTHHTL